MKKKVTIKDMLKMREIPLLIMIVIIITAIGIKEPIFLSSNNMIALAVGMAADGIIVIGMTMILITGSIDLSVGSVFGLVAIVTGQLFQKTGNIWLSALLGLMLGGGIGIIIGLFVTKVNINPFITTLAEMNITRGACYVLTTGTPVPLIGLEDKSPIFAFLGKGRILSIPIIVVIFIVMAIIADILMRRTSFCRKIYYVGSNDKASNLSGISVNKVLMGVFVCSAALASISAVLNLARFGVASVTSGTGAEMRAISGAIIGGTSLKGGVGTISGAVLGVVLLNIINAGMVQLNVPVYWQDLVSGVILLLAVTIDVFSQKKK